ncbi:MAG: serine protease [Treponema sp.]|nr:serine protease [Treponema sp.]
MNEFIEELSSNLVRTVESWKGSLVHIGGPGIPYRTGIVVQEGLAATLARSARDGEQIPVVTASGSATGRVEAWDGETGLALIRLEAGASTRPYPAVPETGETPPPGTPVLRVAYASPQGVEASFSIVRFSGGPTELGRRKVTGHFQVDGPAYPGFLGAAVVDLKGALRGVVVANEDGNDGWILPAGAWKAALEELSREGSRRPGRLGIFLAPVRLSRDQARAAGRDSALMVRGVVPGGPAEEAGLQPGDLILGVDGAELGDGGLPPLRAGAPVTLEILRGSERRALPVVPASRP